MMKFVVNAVRPTGIPCEVSMNPIMIDGTGMCGGCRLTLIQDGKRVTKFACVDGPDFNGYEVDFDEAMARAIKAQFEKRAKTHPYPHEVAPERDLMAIADAKYQESENA